MVSHLIIIASCALGLASGGPTDPPILEMYTLENQGGAEHTMSGYCHDLAANCGFGDVTKSICGNGVWLLYEEADYNGDKEENLRWWSEVFIAPEYTCHNLPVTHQNQLSSIRYAGSGNLLDETLTIYHGFGYTSGEFLAIKDEDSFGDSDEVGSSFIVTGESSWTLYSDRYWEGIAICIEPWNVGSDTHVGTWNVGDVGMPNNDVSSARRGCFSDIIRTKQDSSSVV